MIQITKIFYFEMAHALAGYQGPCSHIHGHSYELHVTIKGDRVHEDYIPAPGMLIDFKQLKAIVTEGVVKQLDHKLVLSKNFFALHPGMMDNENLVIWDIEPTAENMVIFMRLVIQKLLPEGFSLAALKLFETKDSYAEWVV